ncbi:hypothetical protein SDC9_83353 [bioreactor metagenome]|uniref:Uncharacterized protein n=1 Tax=bioreactor metagenome TaxID=1076179 RepID=A0A644Z9V3_9ZZZZ
MKKYVLVIVVLTGLILFFGYGRVEKPSQTSSAVEGKNTDTSSVGTTQQPNQTSSTNNALQIKTYDDETHKTIQYGELVFSFESVGSYHIVSDTQWDSSETFKCEIDGGAKLPVTRMAITIKAIENPNLTDMESIISWLSDMSSNYEQIKLYSNVADDSGIISLYYVTGGGLTYYVASYNDAYYLIESDYSMLDIYLFKDYHSTNYEVNNQEIQCADSFSATVHETISYDDSKAEYDIAQGKEGTNFSAELSLNEKYQYTLALKNEHGEILLTLSGNASSLNEIVDFSDVNVDGYLDVQVLELEGTMNNSYVLYTWDESTGNFDRVVCDEMLSNIEVHDGYLLNWVRVDAQSRVMQKFAWEGNTLIKVSEESCEAEIIS